MWKFSIRGIYRIRERFLLGFGKDMERMELLWQKMDKGFFMF